MPFEALSAKARLMVPVGAMDKQVAVAKAIPGDLGADVVGQASCHAGVEEFVRIEEREAALLAGQRHRGAVGGVAQAAGEAGGGVATLGAVVAQAHQDQRVAETGEAEADAPLGGGLRRLLG